MTGNTGDQAAGFRQQERQNQFKVIKFKVQRGNGTVNGSSDPDANCYNQGQPEAY